MFKSVKKSILLNAANSTVSRQFYVITGRVPVILVQRVTNLVNKFALVFKRSMFRQNSRDKLCVTPENDDIKWGEVLKSAVIFSVFMLFSAAAQAKVCFLPDSNCGGVNYGYTDKSGSTCTYKTREEANRKKGECETVQKQGFCFYLSCSMSKSDCDKAAANDPNHDKCCVPCGNCWKVADCSIPQIETCTGAGYETEQTCKNKNQNFKPNGKFDKNGTACGECKDVPYITCPEMGDNYVTRAECTAKGSSFTFASADVKDSDGNECGTCGKPEPETCTSGYSTAYQSQADCASGETFSSKGMANGKVCGKCTAKTCPSGYSTQYQSQKDCPTGETFSYSGKLNDLLCGKCGKTTCAEMGYKTCTQCTGNQICELNGQEGSDGLCAKGCHNPTTPICSNVTSVSGKYVYIKNLIDGLAINNEAFIRLSNVKDFDLYETMKKAKLLEGFGKSYKHSWDGKTYIDDNNGNLIAVFLRADTVNNKNVELVHLDFYLNKSFANIDNHQYMPISDCIDVYKHLMKPLYCQVNRVGIYTTNYRNDKMTASYGDGICGKDKMCLQTIGDDAIWTACNSCQSDNVRCYMPIIFGKSK